MKKIFYILIILTSVLIGNAQNYAPAVGFKGSTAIHKDSSIFIDWASEVEIYRGYKNVAFPENGFVDYGTNENATGKAMGNPNVVSLGDGGIAIVSFNSPIVNGNGYDFAIFENGFFKNDISELAFLELAFVEVSTDGIEYVRFPAISEINSENQIGSFENINARYIHNFAGKYTMFYGTPFDLADIENLIIGTSVDLNEINYVKIIDVVGTINEEFSTFDSNGNKINDPYPTAFTSGGFDLDAVGVINNRNNIALKNEILIFPNPAKKSISIFSVIKNIEKVEILTIYGKLLMLSYKKNNIDISGLPTGVYVLTIYGNGNKVSSKFVK